MFIFDNSLPVAVHYVYVQEYNGMQITWSQINEYTYNNHS